ncbi:MAG: glycosyltransferase, partial [Rhodoglobus sp.]
ATKFAWRIVRWIHEGADLTLVPSSSSMNDLRGAGVERLARWGRGVDLDTYHPVNKLEPAVQDLRARLAPRGETIVGYVGRIAPEKQVERMSALRGMPGISLVLVGDGPSMASVKRELTSMPVSYLGSLSGSELAAAYASFDVFLHTGTEETFGQTVQEAHASGVPVVAPRAGGPIDLISHGVNGFLYDPADISTMRAYVEALAIDDELRSRLGAAGRRTVLGKSWHDVCGELVGHYVAAIASRAVLSH